MTTTTCLRSGGKELALAARVTEPVSGRVLEMFTTEPAVQLYTANFLDGTLKGKGGVVYKKQQAFCLEAQHYPDSVNQPKFPVDNPPARFNVYPNDNLQVQRELEQRGDRPTNAHAAARPAGLICSLGHFFLDQASSPMKAVAVLPGKPNSVHLREIPVPKLSDQPHPHVCKIPEGRGVLVKVLASRRRRDRSRDQRGSLRKRTSRGRAPGHRARELRPGRRGRRQGQGSRPGDYVSCTVRRPGESIFDLIGRNDITSDEVYYERGINLCHGYLTEYFVDDAEYIVKVPQNLKHLGVLAEPASVCAKAIEQAFLAQQRLQVWDPKRAFVMGSGQIGLLATMMLRLRGMEVHTIATRPARTASRPSSKRTAPIM